MAKECLGNASIIVIGMSFKSEEAYICISCFGSRIWVVNKWNLCVVSCQASQSAEWISWHINVGATASPLEESASLATQNRLTRGQDVILRMDCSPAIRSEFKDRNALYLISLKQFVILRQTSYAIQQHRIKSASIWWSMCVRAKRKNP